MQAPPPVVPMPVLAARASRVSPFIVMDVMNQAAAIERSGGSVVHMEVGQPSAPTPASIRTAAARALEHGRIGYTQAWAPIR
jgi:aspartate/methionine/tyrosine aminotransferase